MDDVTVTNANSSFLDSEGRGMDGGKVAGDPEQVAGSRDDGSIGLSTSTMATEPINTVT